MFASLPHDLTRLRLRALRVDDLEAFYAYRSDPAVARYQGWSPMTRRQATDFLRSESGRSDHPPGTWRQLAIAERATDRLVGDMGVWLGSAGRQAEFGLSITPALQGRGYGTECVHGLIALLFAATAVTEIVASADTRNVACLTMLARSGMHEIAQRQAEYKGELCVERVFACRKDEAQLTGDAAAGGHANTGLAG